MTTTTTYTYPTAAHVDDQPILAGFVNAVDHADLPRNTTLADLLQHAFDAGVASTLDARV